MSNELYKFADFALDSAKRQLFYKNEFINLSSRAFDILLCLINKRGEIVTKDELMEAVWKDSFVEEGNLAVHISALRRILNKGESNVKFIKTISGRGYSFVAPIEDGNSQIESNKEVVRSVSDEADSIAVLPFAFDANDSEIEYLSNGLAQSLISELSQIPDFKVIAYSAVRNYKVSEVDLQEIGFLLNANKILTGHLSKHNGKLNISIELLNAANTSHLWGTQGDFIVSEMMLFKKQISLGIINKLKLQLPQLYKSETENKESINSEAYNLYVKGKYILETISMRDNLKNDLNQALLFFRRSLKKDSKFAPTYTEIGQVYIHLFNNNLIGKTEAFNEADKALKMSLKLNDKLSEAYVLKGTISILFERDLIEAENALIEAVKLNPNNAEAYHWHSLICIYFKRFEEAAKLQIKALQLAPTSIPYSNSLIRIFYYSGEYNQAIVQAEEILELDNRSIPAYYFLALSYAEIGFFDEALKNIEFANKQRFSPDIILAQAYIFALMNKEKMALELVENILGNSNQEDIDYTNVAAVYAALGIKNESFDYLERAYNEGNVDIYLLNVRPQFKNLRQDERFKIMLAGLGLI